MMRKSSHQIGIGIKSLFLSSLFSLLVTSGITQSLQTGSSYLGQTPPGNIPIALPLFVNEGFFAAERIAISSDGRDIYFSEIKSYYPIRGENIKRYTFSDGKWNGPFDLFTGFAPALSPQVRSKTAFSISMDMSQRTPSHCPAISSSVAMVA